MHSIDFSVQGSSPEPYTVSFRYDALQLTVSCTCGAGSKKQVCKHRLNLLAGSLQGVVSDNHDQMASAIGWANDSRLAGAIAELEAAEAAQEAATAEVKALKKKLGLLMG